MTEDNFTPPPCHKADFSRGIVLRRGARARIVVDGAERAEWLLRQCISVEDGAQIEIIFSCDAGRRDPPAEGAETARPPSGKRWRDTMLSYVAAVREGTERLMSWREYRQAHPDIGIPESTFYYWLQKEEYTPREEESINAQRKKRKQTNG